jgi:DNA-binding response OmpR family regulator
MFKIEAILRRTNIDKSNVLELGNLYMNKDEHVAKISDEEINLSVREFDILYFLVSNPKKTFTRSKLMEEFWDYDSSATSRTVDVYLSKIREKTKNCDGFEIQTVHGLGYKVVLL